MKLTLFVMVEQLESSVAFKVQAEIPHFFLESIDLKGTRPIS